MDGAFNYRKDKLNVYGNTSISDLRFISLQNTDTRYPSQLQNQVLSQDNRPLYSFSQAGVDYNFSPNVVLGFLCTYGTLDGERTEGYHTKVL